jgi:hypothetical protein
MSNRIRVFQSSYLRLAGLPVNLFRFGFFLVLFAPRGWCSEEQADNMPDQKQVSKWAYPAGQLWYYNFVSNYDSCLFGFMIVFRMFSRFLSGNGAHKQTTSLTHSI